VILRVGLTGGIASGKSTVLRILGDLGCRIIDADSIVASLYRPGKAGYEALIRDYGRGILAADGEIDRKKLASIAFSAPTEAARLNALIHPLVIAEQTRLMDAADAAGDDAIYVVEATLLLESGGRERFDRIIVVDVPFEIQVDRAVGRGMLREDEVKRIEHQMQREKRLAAADYVIDNTGEPVDTQRRVEEVFRELRRDLEKRKGSG